MRTIPEPADLPEDDRTSRIADWKEGPADVLESVDDLLKPHGLEIVLLDTRSDYYRFRVEKRA